MRYVRNALLRIIKPRPRDKLAHLGLYLSFQILRRKESSGQYTMAKIKITWPRLCDPVLMAVRRHDAQAGWKTYQEFPTVFEPFCSARRRYCAALNCTHDAKSAYTVRGGLLLVRKREVRGDWNAANSTAEGAWRPNL